jgi:hypothetical protein
LRQLVDLRPDAEALEAPVRQGCVERRCGVGDQVDPRAAGGRQGEAQHLSGQASPPIGCIDRDQRQMRLDLAVAEQLSEAGDAVAVGRDHGGDARCGQGAQRPRRVLREAGPAFSGAKRDHAVQVGGQEQADVSHGLTRRS